ncbi:hypothetical protein D3C75_1173600 [compost metagenome]
MYGAVEFTAPHLPGAAEQHLRAVRTNGKALHLVVISLGEPAVPRLPGEAAIKAGENARHITAGIQYSTLCGMLNQSRNIAATAQRSR